MTTPIIIGVVGLIGSGKNTVASYLETAKGFSKVSFASSLKDAVAAVFHWDRTLLEGESDASREWREQVDQWWSNRLSIPHLTPRWVLQHWGTDVLRKCFHDDIWIASLENYLRTVDKNVVISDCRFPNEITAIKQQGGVVVRVSRGSDPDWFSVAVAANEGSVDAQRIISELGIHNSETAWAGSVFDAVIDNNGTLEETYRQVEQIIAGL